MASTSILPSRQGPKSAVGTKFDMNRNPAYQIDCSVEASGKRLAATKRRIRFRFGFSNAEAMANGGAGIECRGEEHEVVIVWSLTSGKQLILADGQEVHFACGNRDTKLVAAWNMRGGHQIQIRAYAFANNQPGFRQFDLLLDGLSFWDMPKMFELGVRRSVVSEPIGYSAAGRGRGTHHSYGGGHGYDGGYDDAHDGGYNGGYDNSYSNGYDDHHHNNMRPSHSYDEPRAARRNTIENGSAARSIRSEPEPSTQNAPEASRRASMPDLISGGAAEAEDLLDSGSGHLVQAPALLGDLTQSPTGVADEFAPVAPSSVGPMPSFQVKANEILSAYGPQMSSPVFPAIANESHTNYAPAPAPTVNTNMSYGGGYEKQHPATPETVPTAPYTPASAYTANSNFSFEQSHQQQYGYHQSPPAQITVTAHAETPGQSLSASSSFQPSISKPLDLNELDRPDVGEDASPLEKSLASLVNFDDITKPLETPQQKAARQRREASQTNKSKPIPATSTTSWLGGSDTPLSKLQTARPTNQQPKKEVMRTHAFDPAAAQAGMMVLYGAPGGSIPAPNGFGAGGYARPQFMYGQ